MERRRLGKSELRITPIGLGCWQFSDRANLPGLFWPALNEVPAQEIIQTTLDGGVNWFDTAEAYGKGASERCVAAGIRAAGYAPTDHDRPLIATKWMPVGRTVHSLVHTIAKRKENLDGFPVDLHQIHAPVALATARAEMRAMAKLLDRGDIRTAGVSNYSAGAMRRAHKALAELGHPLVSNQVEYSLLNRRIESNGVMDTAKELGMTIIAYSPLAQGLLTTKFHDDPALLGKIHFMRRQSARFKYGRLDKSAPVAGALREIAARHEATPGQVALNWLMHFHGETVVVIPGATKLAQAQQNIGAAGFQLSRDELNQLDEVSRPFL